MMRLNENKYVKMWENPNEPFLYFSYKNGTHLTLEAAKEIIRDRLDFTNNDDSLLLLDLTGLKKTNSDARKYMAGDDGVKGLKAGAFIVSNKVSQVIGNFFILINKPLKPARLFTSEEEAKKWLLKFN